MPENNAAQNRDRQWFIVGRWQEFEGESRANLLRIIAVGGFYVVQLIQHHLVMSGKLTEEAEHFHRAATWIAVAWTVMGLTILLCLRSRVFPSALKFVSTGGDLLLLTAVAAIGAKANSPLVYAFFLVIALAALRFSLPLIWFSSIGSMAAYVALVGATDEKWFDVHHEVAIHVQLVTLLSLGLTGIVVGQIIRRTREMAIEFVERVHQAGDKDN